MRYKGYKAEYSWMSTSKCFQGCVFGCDKTLLIKGNTLGKLEISFIRAVERYETQKNSMNSKALYRVS